MQQFCKSENEQYENEKAKDKYEQNHQSVHSVCVLQILPEKLFQFLVPRNYQIFRVLEGRNPTAGDTFPHGWAKYFTTSIAQGI